MANASDCCPYSCLECAVLISTTVPMQGSLLTGQVAFDANTGFYYYQFLGKNLVLNPSWGAGLTYNLATQSVGLNLAAGGGLEFTATGQLQVSCQAMMTRCGFVTNQQFTAFTNTFDGDVAEIALAQATLATRVNTLAASIPAQVIVTAGTGIAVTGTYPNITVTNTLPATAGTPTPPSATPAQYGTMAGVLAPTSAPTVAAPATYMINRSGAADGEVFAWTGTTWVLVGNGAAVVATITAAQAIYLALDNTVAQLTAPRSGLAMLHGTFELNTGYALQTVSAVVYKNGVPIIAPMLFAANTPMLFGNIGSNSTQVLCSAGDVFEMRVTIATDETLTIAQVGSLTKLQLKYI